MASQRWKRTYDAEFSGQAEPHTQIFSYEDNEALIPKKRLRTGNNTFEHRPSEIADLRLDSLNNNFEYSLFNFSPWTSLEPQPHDQNNALECSFYSLTCPTIDQFGNQNNVVWRERLEQDSDGTAWSGNEAAQSLLGAPMTAQDRLSFSNERLPSCFNNSKDTTSSWGGFSLPDGPNAWIDHNLFNPTDEKKLYADCFSVETILGDPNDLCERPFPFTNCGTNALQGPIQNHPALN